MPDVGFCVASSQLIQLPCGETPPAQEVIDDLAYMVDQRTDVAFIMAPDETKIEYIEIRQQAAPVSQPRKSAGGRARRG